MARKPTPALLDETPSPASEDDVINAPVSAIEGAEEAIPAAVEVKIEAPVPTEPAPEPPAQPKRPARKKAAAPESTPAAASIFEVIDNTGLSTESGEAVIEGAVETVTEAVDEVTESPTPVDAALGALPSPLYKPMRTLILASLGLASYAVEETRFIVGKLVERGDLTQKEGAKLMGELSHKAKLPLPKMHLRKGKKESEDGADATAEATAEAAENLQNEAAEVSEKLNAFEETFSEQPAEEQDETKQGKKKVNIKLEISIP